jgi:hypothetical protein
LYEKDGMIEDFKQTAGSKSEHAISPSS